MGGEKILEQALKLKPNEKCTLIEGLLKSLDEPDATLDAIWATEAQRRLEAYRQGKLEGVFMQEVFKSSE